MRNPFTTRTPRAGKRKHNGDGVEASKGKEKKERSWKRKGKEKGADNRDILAGARTRAWAMGVLIGVMVVMVMGLRVVEGLWVGFWGLIFQ